MSLLLVVELLGAPIEPPLRLGQLLDGEIRALLLGFVSQSELLVLRLYLFGFLLDLVDSLLLFFAGLSELCSRLVEEPLESPSFAIQRGHSFFRLRQRFVELFGTPLLQLQLFEGLRGELVRSLLLPDQVRGVLRGNALFELELLARILEKRLQPLYRGAKRRFFELALLPRLISLDELTLGLISVRLPFAGEHLESLGVLFELHGQCVGSFPLGFGP